jgi:L-lactate dehydrogenase complex protein LldG
MDRDAFLARVRAATAQARSLEAAGEDPGLHVPSLDEADLVERFRQAATAADAIVVEESPAEVISILADRLGTDRFLGWAESRLPVHGLYPVLAESGITPLPDVVPDANRLDHQMGYEGVLLGITGAEAGFAESGSLVLRSGPGRPRMASLIPLVHVALLERSAIHRSLAHWADVHADGMRDAANVVFITGPSRTGDIEMKLTKGVHGPKEVHIVLV